MVCVCSGFGLSTHFAKHWFFKKYWLAMSSQVYTIWVNYNISLTWIVRSFGYDFPKINHDEPGVGRDVRSLFDLPRYHPIIRSMASMAGKFIEISIYTWCFFQPRTWKPEDFNGLSTVKWPRFQLSRWWFQLVHTQYTGYVHDGDTGHFHCFNMF